MRTAVVKVKLACLWGKPQKRVSRNVSEDVLMSFCGTGVALCDIPCVSDGMCVHGRREGKVGMFMGEGAEMCLFQGDQRRCHVVSLGSCGNL